MLVKFKNDSQEFEAKIAFLKSKFEVGAASKVAEICVSNYRDLDDRLNKSNKRISQLEELISDLKDNYLAIAESKENIFNLLESEEL